MRIVRGALPKGTVLVERELAASLNISKTPVRQALQILLYDGLLEVGRRRQLVVRGFDAAQREETLMIRAALEEIVVSQACRVRTLDDVDLLRLLLIRQQRLAEQGDDDGFIELDEEFHLTIAYISKLPVATRFLEQLTGFVRLIRIGTLRIEGHLGAIVDEHTAIVDAIEKQDARSAVAAIRAHVKTVNYPGSAVVKKPLDLNTAAAVGVDSGVGEL